MTSRPRVSLLVLRVTRSVCRTARTIKTPFRPRYMVRSKLVTTLVSAAVVVPSAVEGQAVGDLSALLEQTRLQAGIPALVATVASSDSVLAEGVAGVRDVGSDEVATLDDLWHIGSVTKSFTSTLASRLAAEGEFSWNLTLGEVFPAAAGTDFDTVPASALAQHTAGFPRNPPRWWLGAARTLELPYDEQRREVVSAALEAGPEYEPGTEMLYSNLGYMALGSALESRVGEPWQQLLRERVLTPLGLSSAGFGAPGSLDIVDQPRGHRRNAEGELVSFPGLDNPAALGPAGTLHMSIRDLSRYAQEHLEGELGVDGLLSSEEFRRLHRGGLGDYAYGWVDATDPSGRRMIWHNGSNTAWYAFVGLIPDADRIIVIVANAGDAREPVHELLDTLIERWAPAG